MIAWSKKPSGTLVVTVSKESIKEFARWINDEYSGSPDEPDVKAMYQLYDFLLKIKNE